MGKIKFKRINSGIESLQFGLAEIEESISVNGQFKVEVNKEESKLLKLDAHVELYKDKSEDSFMQLNFYGIYETDNNDPNLTLVDIDNSTDLLKDIVPELNRVLTFITKEGLGSSLELPENFSEIHKES
ncbi:MULTISPECIES: hypothetical protein [Enterococcus]|nr:MULTISPECIES: hypothetical protein [Enterococcus]EHV0179408.1 hypothetical protein [Enterococcus faecalis]MCM6932665.1 hypothetical protein [Enterococcus faecalis]MDF4248728.1 hypothetical protein [Enterococcus faecalis]MDQ8620264.1 hypothetical protein [Enterococcus sp. FR008]NSN19885.1 hypothetical protein [Enterococcus faecalis]